MAMFFGGSFLGPAGTPTAPLSGQLQRVGRPSDDAFVPIRSQTIPDSASNSSDDSALLEVLSPGGTGVRSSTPPPAAAAAVQAPPPPPRPSTPLTPRQRHGSFYQSGRAGVAVGSSALVPLGYLADRGGDSCPGTPRSATLPKPSNFLQFEPLEKLPRAKLESGTLALHGPSHKICWNFLVIGAPQTGKSSFINHFRAVTTHSDKWPAASVGRCGKFGTTSVDPFPNRVAAPSWILIDTPGKLYDRLDDDNSEDSMLLARLFGGVPWKTRLVGRGAVPLDDVDCDSTHRPHHCIITVSAVDIVKDMGFMQKIWLKPRYVPSDHADELVKYLNTIVTKVRDLMGDRAPFVVVTHWDIVCPGSPNIDAVKAALMTLGQCIPVGRCYFVSLAAQQSAALAMATTALGSGHASLDGAVDAFSRKEMLRLHRDLMNDVTWQLNQGKQRGF